MLSGLRYFEHALKDNGRGKPKPSFSWGAVDMASVARCFQQLCIKAVDVFQSEPRLLEVNSPTYVLGELLISYTSKADTIGTKIFVRCTYFHHNWISNFHNLL